MWDSPLSSSPLSLVLSGTGSVPSAALAADVSWPVSSLVVSEIQTGGASASDEFVEIANQGAAPVDLAGLEVVYATSSGSTVTRKATWAASTLVLPGRRVLIANAAGIFAPGADLAYSSGFAATGGAIALRVVGGAPSMRWAGATRRTPSSRVPPARRRRRARAWSGCQVAIGQRCRHEREPVRLVRPGGAVAAGESGCTRPARSGSDADARTRDAHPDSGGDPDPDARRDAQPHANTSPHATPTPTPVATPDAHTDAVPTTHSDPRRPPPAVVSIATARALGDDATVTIEGVLTVGLGGLESGRAGFVQDASGGIGLYLDAAAVGSHPAGTSVRVTGTLGSRYHQRVLRIAESDIVAGALADLPTAVSLATGAATERSRDRGSRFAAR